MRLLEWVDQVADRRSGAAFAAIAVAALGGLLYVGRSFTFWHDEWRYVVVEGIGTPAEWLAPHNEHWTTLPFLLYRLTFLVVGLQSYLPYLATLLLLHVVAVAGIFVLVRPAAGPLVALGAAGVLLVLGSGYENLMWAFQTAFVGSVAAGTWALVSLERPGRVAVAGGSLLLLASVISSGIGLFFVAAAAAELLADPARRRRLGTIVPPLVAYAGWYIAFGRTGIESNRSPFAAESLLAAPGFAATGLAHAAASMTGLGPVAGPSLLLGLVLLTGLTLVARRAPARAVGALTGLVVMYLVIGIVRAEVPGDFAFRSRYVYVAAFFLILAASAWLSRLTARGIGGALRPPWPVLAILTGLALIAGVSNLLDLREGRADFRTRAGLTRAYIELSDRYRDAPWVDPAVRPPGMPTREVLDRLIARHGSPTRDALVPSVVPRTRAVDRERALLHLVGRHFAIERASADGPARPIRLLGLSGADAIADGDCLRVRSSGASVIAVRVPDGGAVGLQVTWGGEVAATLGHEGAPAPRTLVSLPVDPGDRVRIRVPQIGDAASWHVRVELRGAPGELRLCVHEPGETGSG